MSNMQFVPAVFWGQTQRLALGKLVFYARGTTQPQTVYADLGNTIPLNGPDGSLVLDSAGHADIFLGPNAYTVWAFDQYGAQQFTPVDVQGGGGVGGGFGAIQGPETADLGTGLIVKTYTDVSALLHGYDVLYVEGRTTPGDGGQGWFARIPGSSATPDNGMVLTVGSTVYQRITDGWIDPRWYGVAYGATTDQSAATLNAQAASARFGLPVLYTDVVYLTASLSFPANSSARCSWGGNFQAPSAITLTLPASVKFESTGVAFGTNVQPKFGVGVAPEILLSWMGDAVPDVRVTKLSACLDASMTGPQRIVVDESVTTSTAITFPAVAVVDWTGGAKITVNAAANVSIPTISYQGSAPILLYSSALNVQTVQVGSGSVRPEWFGAMGDGTADDSLPLYVAMKHGKVFLVSKYRLGTSRTVANDVTFMGLLPSVLDVPPTQSASYLAMTAGCTIQAARLTLDSVEVKGLGLGNVVTCSLFTTRNSAVGFAFTNSTPGFVSCSGSLSISKSLFTVQDLISATGGTVDQSTFTGSGSFPLTLVDRITSSTFTGYAGHASTSHRINTLVDLSTLSVSGSLNVGTSFLCRASSVGSIGSAPCWGFVTQQASSTVTVQATTFAWSGVKLNGTSTLNIDAFAADVVNSAAASPADTESSLLSNGQGTVNLLHSPTQVGQLWASVGGIASSRARWSKMVGQITTWGPDWTVVSGSAPTGDFILSPVTWGTYFTPANANAFEWRLTATTDSPYFNLAGWTLMGGILQLTITTPSGAASGGTLQVTIDQTGSGFGNASTLNKRIRVPATSGTETILVQMPVLGGYWDPSNLTYTGQWTKLLIDLQGSNLAGYKIRLDAIHDLPAGMLQKPLWSQSIQRPLSSGQLQRTVDFLDIQNGKISTAAYWTVWPSAGSNLILPGCLGSSSGGIAASWYGSSNFDLLLVPRWPHESGNYYVQAQSNPANSAAVAANCFELLAVGSGGPAIVVTL